jgi:hypothetical protein
LHHRRVDGSGGGSRFGILAGGGLARDMPRRSDSVDRGAVDRDALRDGNVASWSTDVIASVVLVYTARTIGPCSTTLVWS